MTRKSLGIGGAILAVLAGLLLYNGVVYMPVARALSNERGVSMIVYRQWLLSPDTIVLDLRSLSANSSMVDVDRSLFAAAEALKDMNFANVVLTYRGSARFILEGAHFRTIGEERQTQNPIYTIRTLGEHLHELDGRPAFGTWEGGLLGVLGKQMEDHQEFHARWYLRELGGLPENAPLSPVN